MGIKEGAVEVEDCEGYHFHELCVFISMLGWLSYMKLGIYGCRGARVEVDKEDETLPQLIPSRSLEKRIGEMS